MGYIFETTAYDWLVLVATLAALAYFYVKSKQRYFSDRGMPYAEHTFKDFIGLFKLRRNLNDELMTLYEKHNNYHYKGFYQFITPCYFIFDPDLAQKIFIKDFSHFNDHGLLIDEKFNPLDGNLFLLNGDKWKSLRHKLVPTFSTAKLKWMLPMMEDCADQLVKSIKVDKCNKDVSIKELFREYTVNAIASCAFGIDIESIKEPDCEFRRMIYRVFNPTYLEVIRGAMRFIIPRVAIFLKVKSWPQDVEDFFLSMTKQSFEYRKRTGVKRNDFIQLLLELREKGSIDLDPKDADDDEKEIPIGDTKSVKEERYTDKIELTDGLLCAQSVIFFTAGFENAAQVISLVAYLISKEPEVQTRLRNEIKEMKEKHQGLNYVAMRDMKYLDACVSETLRLYPPSPLVMRSCNKTYTLPDGKKIEKGQTLFVPVIAFQNDPKYWDNPKEFNPDRFLKDQIIPGTYLPFGDGPRICIAQRFALLQIKCALVKILENFEILPSSKTKEPLEILSFIFNDVVGGLWAILKPIENNE